MQKKQYGNTAVSKLATVLEAQERYRMSRASLIQLAEKANAIRRFGRMIRIDAGLLDKFIDEQLY